MEPFFSSGAAAQMFSLKAVYPAASIDLALWGLFTFQQSALDTHGWPLLSNRICPAALCATFYTAEFRAKGLGWCGRFA